MLPENQRNTEGCNWFKRRMKGKRMESSRRNETGHRKCAQRKMVQVLWSVTWEVCSKKDGPGSFEHQVLKGM